MSETLSYIFNHPDYIARQTKSKLESSFACLEKFLNSNLEGISIICDEWDINCLTKVYESDFTLGSKLLVESSHHDGNNQTKFFCEISNYEQLLKYAYIIGSNEVNKITQHRFYLIDSKHQDRPEITDYDTIWSRNMPPDIRVAFSNISNLTISDKANKEDLLKRALFIA